MKIAKFNSSWYFIPDYGTFITPSGEPEQVIEIDKLEGEDILALKKNPNDPKILDKIKNK